MANTLYPQLESFSLYSSGASIGDTTLVLTTFLSIDGVQLTMANFGDKGFMTLEPGAGSNEEQISFTGVTANSNGTTTLTGVKTVLHLSPYTETSGLAKPHSGGSKAVVAVTSGLLNQFANKGNTETVTGAWTFPNGANTPILGTSYVAPTISWQVASKGYVDGVAVAGAPNASTTVKGIVELATGAETAAGTATGGTGAALVPANSNFKNVSAGVGDASKVPVLNGSGVLDQTFLDTPRTWAQVQTFTANSCQITTDPDSANDAVRSSYLTSSLGALVQNVYSDGSDGNVTISVPTTLSRDMYYNNLILTGANDVDCNGYKVFANSLTRNAGSTAKLKNNGTAGTAGTDGTNGAAGAAGAAGLGAPGNTLPPGVDGQAGAAGTRRTIAGSQDGNSGTAGTAKTETLTASAGGSGGRGGNNNAFGTNSGAGGLAGPGGSATQTKVFPRSFMTLSLAYIKGTVWTITIPNSGSGSGSSGGVSCDGANNVASGGTGGSGGSGGMLFVAARSIVDLGTGTMFQAVGGAGGAAGNSYAAGGTSGGNASAGSGGGSGGHIIRVSTTITGAAPTDVSGGAAGANGLLANAPFGVTVTSSPTAGPSGTVFDIDL